MAQQGTQPFAPSTGSAMGEQAEERKESVIPGTFWVQKNTFLEVEEPPRASARKREHSAPPSVASSSHSVSSDSKSSLHSDGLAKQEESEVDEDVLQDEDLLREVERAAAAECEVYAGSVARKGKRPGRMYRQRFKALTREVKHELRADPTIDIEERGLPAWLENDMWLKSRFLTHMRGFKEKLLRSEFAENDPGRSPDEDELDHDSPVSARARGAATGPAPSAKRAASKGAPKSCPKRQCRPAAPLPVGPVYSSSSTWWPYTSSDVAPGGSPQGSPGSRSSRGRDIMSL